MSHDPSTQPESSSTASGEGAPEPRIEQLLADPETVVYRRTRRPNIVAFMGAGTVLGLLAAGVWTFSKPETTQYSYSTVLGYTALLLGFLGAMIGGLLGVLLDRRR